MIQKIKTAYEAAKTILKINYQMAFEPVGGALTTEGAKEAVHQVGDFLAMGYGRIKTGVYIALGVTLSIGILTILKSVK